MVKNAASSRSRQSQHYSPYKSAVCSTSRSRSGTSAMTTPGRASSTRKSVLATAYRPTTSFAMQKRSGTESLRRSNRIQEMAQRKKSTLELSTSINNTVSKSTSSSSSSKALIEIKPRMTVATPSTPKRSVIVSRTVTAKSTPRTNNLKRKIEQIDLSKDTSNINSIHPEFVGTPKKTNENVMPSWDEPDGHYKIIQGDMISGIFKVVSLLGQGTFGKVVKALDTRKNEYVAVKIIKSVRKYRRAAESEIRILKYFRFYDPNNARRCIHLIETFDHKDHVCMVFKLLSESVFDFMKENNFFAFPIPQVKHLARQLLESVAYIHSLGIIHTDLKPENLMLVNNQYKLVPIAQGSNKMKKQLVQTDIQLIDFGSAIFSHDNHSSVVCTRHYRAPEIILGLGWSFPCDIWSIGCILIELFTGEALFQTHDNIEHLAIMEKVLGYIPMDFKMRSNRLSNIKLFDSNYELLVSASSESYSQSFVNNCPSLRDTISPTNQQELLFLDLLSSMLQYDPLKRVTANVALEHPFFSS